VILLAAIGAVFAFIVQPWYLGWGATPEERRNIGKVVLTT